MDAFPTGDEPPETPEAMLDALRNDPSADEDARDAQLARIVERFPAARLREAVQGRLRRLGGDDGEAILRLVEAYATPELLDELARAIEDQPDLPPERAWAALELLEGAGVIERHPALVERWWDLNESLDSDEDALGTLVDQLEEEPEGSWVALEGLGAVEPEVRAGIIAGLADFPSGPGLVQFLRLLTFCHEPKTQAAALDALAAGDLATDGLHRGAWASIAHDHPDPAVRDRAIGLLGPDAGLIIAEALDQPGRPRPRIVRTLVTALDGGGRGSVVIGSVDRGRQVVANFLCDVRDGVVEVMGEVADDPGLIAGAFEGYEAAAETDFVVNAPGLADGLLGGSLLLSGPGTNPSLRYWLERTVGPEFRARPFAGLIRDDDLAEHALETLEGAVGSILEACPHWVDASDLTYQIAEEIALRSDEQPLDPRLDAGAYRYLFEHRLLGRLEHYRRMLLWMASFWQSSNHPDLARSSLTLAWQLSDPQHAVPAHPFTVALTTRSLLAAIEDIQSGRNQQGR